jgi:hypothetical protein
MASIGILARAVAVRALLAIAPLSAATTVSSLAHANGSPPSAAAKLKAKRAFERGQEYYKQGKFAEAGAAFQESYDAVPEPKALLMLARVQRDDGELLKARATCQKALDGAEAAEAMGRANGAPLDEIKGELRAIDGVLGFVVVQLAHAPPGTHVSIDDSDVTSQLGKPIRAEPGPLVVTAIDPGGTERSENAMVKAGQTSSVTLSFPWSGRGPNAVTRAGSGKSDEARAETPRVDDEKTPPPRPKLEPSQTHASTTKRTLTWVAGGVGLVGLATFGVFWELSGSKFKHLDRACPESHCDPSLERDKNTGKTFQTVANVGLAVGAVGLGAAVTLLALGGTPDAARPNQATRTKLELGLGRITFSGSFQ